NFHLSIFEMLMSCPFTVASGLNEVDLLKVPATVSLLNKTNRSFRENANKRENE
ncbi:6060_t:CDS:1, partial [Ambispora leptoticha]